MAIWDEQSGVPEVDEWSGRFGRRGLLNKLLNTGGDSGEPEDYPMESESAESSGAGQPSTSGQSQLSPPLAHRIADDAHTAANRSGGPASDGGFIKDNPPYQAPGRSRLKDMMDRESTMENAPRPKVGMGRRLLTALSDAGPTALASALGSAGGTVGADQRMRAGVQRRQSQMDLETTRKREDINHLKDQIEAQSRTVEQQEYQHGEDTMREQTAEAGMNSRARLAEAAEDARSRRQSELFSHQDRMQSGKFEHDEEMEDQKQVGRMQLQMERNKGAQTIARIRAASASMHIPPVLSKSVDTFESSQSRLDVMQKAYDAAIRDPGNQQAMLNMLSNHLGMTMGLQPNARITQALIDEAKRSGYLTERVEAHFGPDGFMTGAVLTPRQMGQMMTLARERLIEDSRKVQEMEGYFGVQGKTKLSPQIPGSSTNQAATGAAGGPGGVAGAAPTGAPKTAEEYLKKRKQRATAATGTTP